MEHVQSNELLLFINELFSNLQRIPNLDYQLVYNTSYLLGYMYQNQLINLTEESIKVLANFCYETLSKTGCDINSLTSIRKKSDEKIKLKTKNGSKWTVDGLLHRSGILVIVSDSTTDYYGDYPCDHNKYGFRFGTTQEAESSELNIVETSNKFRKDFLNTLKREERLIAIQSINEGKSYLTIASEIGNEDAFLFILEQMKSEEINLEFFTACETGNIQLVKRLSIRVLDINVKNSEEMTPIFIAVTNNQIDVVEYLLSIDGIDVNVLSADNFTPLAVACAKGYVEIVKLLIPKVSLNFMIENRPPEFYIACEQGHVEIVKILQKNRKFDKQIKEVGVLSLIGAVTENKLNVVRTLLNETRINLEGRLKGLRKFNQTNSEQMIYKTPEGGVLHVACVKGYTRIIAALVEKHKLNVNLVDFEMKTALFHLCQKGDLFPIQLLLMSGRKFNLAQKAGAHTAISMAKLMSKEFLLPKDYQAIVELLENFEKDPKATTQILRNDYISHLFALTVLLTDEYLNIINNSDLDIIKFFRIMIRLPIELQMVICNRTYWSLNDIVPSNNLEQWFRYLLTVLRINSS